MALIADHSSQGRIELQHMRRLPASRACGRLFLSYARCRDASIASQHGNMVAKRDQFLVTMRTDHAPSRGIEHEDQRRFSASWAPHRLHTSSDFIGFVKRHDGPTRLTHEKWVTFLWSYRWRIGSSWRQPGLFPSMPWLVPPNQDNRPFSIDWWLRRDVFPLR